MFPVRVQIHVDFLIDAALPLYSVPDSPCVVIPFTPILVHPMVGILPLLLGFTDGRVLLCPLLSPPSSLRSLIGYTAYFRLLMLSHTYFLLALTTPILFASFSVALLHVLLTHILTSTPCFGVSLDIHAVFPLPKSYWSARYRTLLFVTLEPGSLLHLLSFS